MGEARLIPRGTQVGSVIYHTAIICGAVAGRAGIVGPCREVRDQVQFLNSPSLPSEKANYQERLLARAGFLFLSFPKRFPGRRGEEKLEFGKAGPEERG